MKTLGLLVTVLVFSVFTVQVQMQILTPKKKATYWIDMGRARENFCTSKDGCLKRSIRQDEMGPFWANRGKKDPNYMQERLYAEEPHWILVPRDDDVTDIDYDPFFITRGKKDDNDSFERYNFLKKKLKEIRSRDRRDYFQSSLNNFEELSPFFAARGKKAN